MCVSSHMRLLEELTTPSARKFPQEPLMTAQQKERPQSPPQGDQGTPDKTQGQMKYAPGQKSEGGAGAPQKTRMET